MEWLQFLQSGEERWKNHGKPPECLPSLCVFYMTLGNDKGIKEGKIGKKPTQLMEKPRAWLRTHPYLLPYKELLNTFIPGWGQHLGKTPFILPFYSLFKVNFWQNFGCSPWNWAVLQFSAPLVLIPRLGRVCKVMKKFREFFSLKWTLLKFSQSKGKGRTCFGKQGIVWLCICHGRCLEPWCIYIKR